MKKNQIKDMQLNLIVHDVHRLCLQEPFLKDQIFLLSLHEQILNKKVMVLINLKPRKMMGFESQGMLLLADDGDGNLSLMQPDSNISNGSVVA